VGTRRWSIRCGRFFTAFSMVSAANVYFLRRYGTVSVNSPFNPTVFIDLVCSLDLLHTTVSTISSFKSTSIATILIAYLPLWSSGQFPATPIQRSRVQFLALPDIPNGGSLTSHNPIRCLLWGWLYFYFTLLYQIFWDVVDLE
jgi:hypothetical protein